MTKLDKQLYINLGQELRELREEKGYSLEEVAQRVGLSKKTIQRYETAESRISIDNLMKICKVLDADVEKFKNYFIIDFDASESSNITNKAGTTTLAKNEELLKSVDFISAQDAMEFMLGQNQIMAFGGYNFDRMSDEQKIQLANKMLKLLKLEAEGLLDDEDLEDDVYEI